MYLRKRNKFVKRTVTISAVLLMTAIIGSVFNGKISKAECVDTSGGEQSMNISSQDYERNASTVKSYLVTNNDGTISRVEAREDVNHADGAGYLLIENYDSNFKYLSFKKIIMELSYFGGFYSGNEFNYLVLGQQNYNQDNSAEVIRIIKYSKSWDKVSSLSLSGINTVAPFVDGACRMSEANGKLYIRASRRMYKSNDGNNHQSNITFFIDEASMKLDESQVEVSKTEFGYVSHSYNQFVLAFRNNIYAVDQGDTYPRAIMGGMYQKNIGNDGTIASTWVTSNLIDLAGAVGNNMTGASVGGLEASGSKIIVAGNIVNQDLNAVNNKVRNIYIATSSLDMKTSKNVNMITKYQEDGLISASTPQLLKINDGYFMLLWEVKQRASAGLNFYKNGEINYVFINGEGNIASEIFSIQGSLSDCKPVVYNGKAVWYVTNISTPVFYSLKTNGQKEDPAVVGTSFKNGEYTFKVTKNEDEIYEVAVTGLAEKSNTLSKAVIPQIVSYNGYNYKITSVAANSFKKNTTIKSVVIPSSIKLIGKNAFYNCSILKKVTIGTTDEGSKLTKIKSKAFYKCTKLKNVIIYGKKLKTLEAKCISKIYSKAVIKCPKSKLKAYTKLLTSKTGYLKTFKLKSM